MAAEDAGVDSDRIFLNHAGTSSPKAPGVAEAVARTLTLPHPAAAAECAAHARTVAAMFGARSTLEPREPAVGSVEWAKPRLLVTTGCTQAISAAVWAQAWAAGDVALMTAMEHEGVAAPLRAVELRCGVELVRVTPRDGGRHIDAILDELRARRAGGAHVRLIAVTAAASVTGDVLLTSAEVRRLAAAAHEGGTRVLLDAAQLVGNAPAPDVAELDVDYFAFGGHKGLRGPCGVGGLILRAPPLPECSAPGGDTEPIETPVATFETFGDDLRFPSMGAPKCDPSAIARDGTTEPSFCDVGSVNVAGLAGLAAAVATQLRAFPNGDFNSVGRALAARVAREMRAMRDEEAARGGPTLTIYGVHGSEDAEGGAGREEPPEPVTLSFISFNIAGFTAAECGTFLTERCGVVVNGSLQCAPEAHAALGTRHSFNGTARISFGPTNTDADATRCIEAVRALLRHSAGKSATAT